MRTMLKKTGAVVALVMLIGGGTIATADPLEVVLGMQVHNAPAYVASLEEFYATDVMRGRKATLWLAAIPGSTRPSHVLVMDFDDFDDHEDATSRQFGSPAQQRYTRSLAGVADREMTLMVVQRLVEGSGWQNHGVLAAFDLSVSDPATYAGAFAELMEATDNPGSVRLMELRFGGQGQTHVVLVSAPGPAALNEYLDELYASDAFARFAAQVRDIRTVNNVAMYRRVRTFGD